MKQAKPFFFIRLIKSWGNVFFASLLVLAIFVLLEILSFNHNLNVDLTPGKVYTMSEQTKQVLKSLDREVEFVSFYKMGERVELEDFFQRLHSLSPKVKYQLIDMDRNPGKAKMYGVSFYGQTVIEYGGKRKVISHPTEERVINAILMLSRDKMKVIYFSKGHGELENYSDLSKDLVTEHWKVEAIYLMEREGIPLNGSVLIIGGPEKDFFDHEIALLEQYLDKGGKAVLLLEPFIRLARLEDFLGKYGLILSEDIIIDKQNKLFGGDYLAPLIPLYARCPITTELRSASIFPTARSVNTKKELSDELSVIPIARSAPHSWAKTNQKEVRKGNIDFQSGVDRPGPIDVAVLVGTTKEEAGGEKTEGELVCFGDSDFIKDPFYNVLGNKDLFLNTVEWLARDKDLMLIRPTKFEYPYHFLSADQGRMLFWTSVIILPVVFLVIGAAIFLFRRLRG